MNAMTSWGLIVAACAAVTIGLVFLRGRVLPNLGRRDAFTRPNRPAATCPHLGLAGDPFKHQAGPLDEHRCYLGRQPDRIDQAHQQGFCLSTAYRRCPWLMVHPAGRRPSVATWAAIGRRAVGRGARAGLAGALQAIRRGGLAAGQHGRAGSAALARSLRAGAVLVRRQGAWALPILARAAIRVFRRSAIAGGSALRLGLRLAPRLIGRAFQLTGRAGMFALHQLGRLRRARLPRRRIAPAGAPAPVPAIALPVVAAETARPAAPETVAVVAASLAQPLPVGPDPTAIAAARLAAHEADLVERGLQALEARRESEAHDLFRRAAQLNPRSARAWFLIAKTAPTLDDVIEALERAIEIEPESERIRTNLVWALRRREHAREQVAEVPTPAADRAPRPSGRTIVSAVPTPRPWLAGAIGLVRAVAAAAAILIGAAWITSGLPAELLGAWQAAADGLATVVPIVDLAARPDTARFELWPGYDAFLAVPFTLGFLALLVASGLLNREGWTRIGAPLTAAITLGLWFGVFATAPTGFGLAICALVAVGGILAPLGDGAAMMS